MSFFFPFCKLQMSRLQPSKHEKETLEKLSDSATELKPRRKRKRPGGPNPLSVLKSKRKKDDKHSAGDVTKVESCIFVFIYLFFSGAHFLSCNSSLAQSRPQFWKYSSSRCAIEFSLRIKLFLYMYNWSSELLELFGNLVPSFLFDLYWLTLRWFLVYQWRFQIPLHLLSATFLQTSPLYRKLHEWLLFSQLI